MEKVRPWCGQPSDRGRLKNRTEQYGNIQKFAVIPESSECQGCQHLYHANVPKHAKAVILRNKNE